MSPPRSHSPPPRRRGDDRRRKAGGRDWNSGIMEHWNHGRGRGGLPNIPTFHHSRLTTSSPREPRPAPTDYRLQTTDYRLFIFSLLRPVIGGRIRTKPEAVTGLGGRDVAEKLPATVDSRGDNVVAYMLRQWSMNLRPTSARLRETSVCRWEYDQTSSVPRGLSADVVARLKVHP